MSDDKADITTTDALDGVAYAYTECPDCKRLQAINVELERNNTALHQRAEQTAAELQHCREATGWEGTRINWVQTLTNYQEELDTLRAERDAQAELAGGLIDIVCDPDGGLYQLIEQAEAERGKEAACAEDWFRRYNACSDERDAHQGESVDARNERDALLGQIAEVQANYCTNRFCMIREGQLVATPDSGRMQALERVAEAAREMMNAKPDDDPGWGATWYALSDELDALAALRQGEREK